MSAKRRKEGFSLLELVVVVAIIALLFAIALERYLYLAERAEAEMVRQNIQAIKTGMRLAILQHLVRGETLDKNAFAGQNPIAWLEEPMSGYRGEYSAERAPTCRGCWYFDTTNRQLVYRPRLMRHFQPASAGTTEVRLWVETPQENRQPAVNAQADLAMNIDMWPTLWFNDFSWFDLFPQRSLQ